MTELSSKYDGNLFIYNGFTEPIRVDNVHDLIIESSTLGDVTAELFEELREFKKYADDFITDEQPFAVYGIYFKPSKQQLQKFNISVMLPKDMYLDAWATEV